MKLTVASRLLACAFVASVAVGPAAAPISVAAPVALPVAPAPVAPNAVAPTDAHAVDALLLDATPIESDTESETVRLAAAATAAAENASSAGNNAPVNFGSAELIGRSNVNAEALPRTAYAPRCLTCPAVAPDPFAPIVSRGDATSAPAVSWVKTTDPVVFITIDDGEVWNEDAAQLLELARLPVTLFLTERYIVDKQAGMRRLVESGAWVESHTVSHPNLLVKGNAEAEICGPLDRYATSFGRRGTLFRPPYGNFNATTQRVVSNCGMEAVVLWRASMNNGALATQGGDLRPGDIVLMHFRPDLADNLNELFRIINERGLRVGRLECYVGGDERCGRSWR